MKVLILSVSVGHGHKVSAEAIASGLTDKGADCCIVDIMEHSSPHLRKIITNGYLWTALKLPRMYRTAYNFAEKERRFPVKPLSLVVEHIYLTKLARRIADFNPDCILCTHVFAALPVALLKKRRYITTPLYGLVTDYCIHPYWSDIKQLDYLITASPLLSQEAIKKGIPGGKILPFGIPLRSQFYCHEQKRNARILLGMDPDRFTVMMSGGGLGCGSLYETIEEIDSLPDDIQIINICGTNNELKAAVDNRIWKKEIFNYGYVDNIHLMMDAADCLIGKPGGMTVTEAIAKRLPFIILKPIPGHEERNAEFLVRHNAGVLATSDRRPAKIVHEFVSRPKLRKRLQRNISGLNLENSNAKLCRFILDSERYPAKCILKP